MTASVAGQTRGFNRQTNIPDLDTLNRLNCKRNECEIFANNVKSKGVIDTGSEISTVSEEFWISLSSRPEIHVTE